MRKAVQFGIFLTISVISTTVCCQTEVSADNPVTEAYVDVAVEASTDPSLLKSTKAEPISTTVEQKTSGTIGSTTMTTTTKDEKIVATNEPKILTTLATTSTPTTKNDSPCESDESLGATKKPTRVIGWKELNSTASNVKASDATFIKLGSYRGNNNTNEYHKTYFIPQQFRGDWLTAKIVCKTFGMDLVTFESLDEFTSFQTLCHNSKDIKSSVLLHVDGITKEAMHKDEWYFTKNGRKIPFKMTWMHGEPNNANNVEYCLSVGRANEKEMVKFNDIICNNTGKILSLHKFVCQKVDFVF